MSRTKYSCPSCGSPVLKARWEAGYQYCKQQTCARALGTKHNLLYEAPPDPGTVDLDPYDLDDVASMYGDD